MECSSLLFMHIPDKCAENYKTKQKKKKTKKKKRKKNIKKFDYKKHPSKEQINKEIVTEGKSFKFLCARMKKIKK